LFGAAHRADDREAQSDADHGHHQGVPGPQADPSAGQQQPAGDAADRHVAPGVDRHGPDTEARILALRRIPGDEQADDVEQHAEAAGERQHDQRGPHDEGVDAVRGGEAAGHAGQHAVGPTATEGRVARRGVARRATGRAMCRYGGMVSRPRAVGHQGQP
jgi:hypothetical protein